MARHIHSQLLMGVKGSWLVELAACWAIVLLATGLYQLRLVTHLDVDDAGIDHAIAVLRDVLH